MNATHPRPPRLTPETLADCLRRGCYTCLYCSRISHVGEYFEPEHTPGCPHCKKRGALLWLPPVLDDRRN
jgi:hypothetical protein